jgi:hypothetical protein
MFGNVTTLEGFHMTGNYRDRSMLHTCSRNVAWDPHKTCESSCSSLSAGGLDALSVQMRAYCAVGRQNRVNHLWAFAATFVFVY